MKSKVHFFYWVNPRLFIFPHSNKNQNNKTNKNKTKKHQIQYAVQDNIIWMYRIQQYLLTLETRDEINLEEDGVHAEMFHHLQKL